MRLRSHYHRPLFLGEPGRMTASPSSTPTVGLLSLYAVVTPERRIHHRVSREQKVSLRAQRSDLLAPGGLSVGRASETVWEFRSRPHSCRGHRFVNRTRSGLYFFLAAANPCRGTFETCPVCAVTRQRAGLRPAPTTHRATILSGLVILRQFHLARHSQ